MNEVETKVREVLAALPTLFLATSCGDEPWVAGGFFAESDPFTLVMVLESSGTTLRNIKANPRVSVVVSSGNPFTAFLQGSADVSLVTEASEVQAAKAALLAKAPQIEPFLAAPLEAVRLHVRCWRATDVPNGWLPGKTLEAQPA